MQHKLTLRDAEAVVNKLLETQPNASAERRAELRALVDDILGDAPGGLPPNKLTKRLAAVVRRKMHDA